MNPATASPDRAPQDPAGPTPSPSTEPETKPRLRGWLHAATVPLLGAGIIVLIATAPGGGAKAALAIYLACALLLFGNSATYHIGHWSPAVKAVLRRIDHSNIYLFVAGTYTPLAVILLSGSSRIVLLSLIWGLAVAGVLFRVLWLGAPRWLYTAMYIVMGWAALWWLPQFARQGGVAIIVLILAGGVVYSASMRSSTPARSSPPGATGPPSSWPCADSPDRTGHARSDCRSERPDAGHLA